MRSYSWANEVCADNNEQRAVVISSMNGFQYAVAAWLPIVIFPQTMAPSFRESLAIYSIHICPNVHRLRLPGYIWVGYCGNNQYYCHPPVYLAG